MSREKELEEKYGKIRLEDAIDKFLQDYDIVTPLVDDEARKDINNMFEYYGVQRLGKGFDKLEMASRMYLVGGIVHRFTSGLPEGAGFAEVKMENSDWQALLVRKGSGYQAEVDALIAASEE